MSNANGKKNGSNISALFQMFAVSLISILLYDWLRSPDTSGSNIVVVDTKRILQAEIDSATQSIMQGAEMNQQQLEAKGQQFGVSFLQAVRRYSAGGTIVVDSQLAVGVPTGLDITETIAAELGLELQPIRDPFATPDVGQ